MCECDLFSPCCFDFAMHCCEETRIFISEQGFAHWCTLCTLGESDQQCAQCAHVLSLVPGTCFTLGVACIQSKDTALWGYE